MSCISLVPVLFLTPCVAVVQVREGVRIPVIASSGAGSPEHFTEVFNSTDCSAALAAGIFHRQEVPVSSVKEELVNSKIPTRR